MKAVPVREIHEIELTSVCSLACVYCPHPTLQREKAHMPWETFERTLEHVEYLCGIGTQGEVSLTGIGEAILYPRFEEAARRVRAVIGNRKLVLSTNGTHMTPEIARLLAELKFGVYVSLHRPEVAAPALHTLEEAGCGTGTNTAFVDSSLDWAGQVKWHVSAPIALCGYLSRAGPWCGRTGRLMRAAWMRTTSTQLRVCGMSPGHSRRMRRSYAQAATSMCRRNFGRQRD